MLTIGVNTVAVFKNSEQSFKIFYSHSRDLYGMPDSFGKCTLVCIEGLEIYLSADINIFAEARFSLQDTDEMYYIPGYELFRNDNSNSSNASRPYGGTAVYSKIPYLTGYPCCNNIHGIELTIIKIINPVDLTIIGIYRSPILPVRQLCQAIAETLNSITPDDNVIIL